MTTRMVGIAAVVAFAGSAGSVAKAQETGSAGAPFTNRVEWASGGTGFVVYDDPGISTLIVSTCNGRWSLASPNQVTRVRVLVWAENDAGQWTGAIERWVGCTVTEDFAGVGGTSGVWCATFAVSGDEYTAMKADGNTVKFAARMDYATPDGGRAVWSSTASWNSWTP